MKFRQARQIILGLSKEYNRQCENGELKNTYQGWMKLYAVSELI